jgi:hypothetical protein
MNFNTGDKVKFLNDIGEGTIIGFQDHQYAMVQMADGFEVPFKISELIKIEGAQTVASLPEGLMKETIVTETAVEGHSPEKVQFKDEEQGIYLAFVKKNLDLFIMHLVNDTDYTLQYLLCRYKDNKALHLHSGRLEDNTKMVINSYNGEELKKLGGLNFQAILMGKKKFQLQLPINKFFEVKNLTTNNQEFTKNGFFEEKAAIVKLENDDLKKRSINLVIVPSTPSFN